jgi:ADP-ribose pyrophosphatase YjhB (NUDIX family)
MPTQVSTPSLAVSTVIFTLQPNDEGVLELRIPLVRRIREPYADMWALPGGPLDAQEGLAASASRTLRETTALEPRYLEQLYAFGDPERSPGERVVSIVYWALVGGDEAGQALTSENVAWFAADDVPTLAFDHNAIVDYALWRLRTKLEYSRIAHGFLGPTFTLAELREVYEVILQRPIDPGNFRRTIESSRAIVPTGERVKGTRHRPPQLYRYNEESA